MNALSGALFYRNYRLKQFASGLQSLPAPVLP
jgi:hypothetical protein